MSTRRQMHKVSIRARQRKEKKLWAVYGSGEEHGGAWSRRMVSLHLGVLAVKAATVCQHEGTSPNFAPPTTRASQAAEKTFPVVVLSPFAVILSSDLIGTKDPCHFAQGKLREGSRSAHSQGNTRFFVAGVYSECGEGAPQNDNPESFFRSLFTPALPAAGKKASWSEKFGLGPRWP